MRLHIALTTALLLAGLSLPGAKGAFAQGPGATRVAKGSFMAPQFSPDGTRLLVTGERLHGVGEIAIATGTVRWHLDEAGIGVHSHYRSDGSVGFRAKRAGKIRHLRIGTDGTIEETQEPAARVFAKNDRIYLRTDSGVTNVGTGDRFFAPKLSPDESKIAFTGLATGVHVYDIASKTLIRVGSGTAPAWSPDSKSLAFERTEDDGHNIVGSDLWIWNEGSAARELTHTQSLLERRPTWSPDGSKLAFDDDRGSIYVTTVTVRK
ncbi:MAG: hypothetical protein GY811_24600 [Myxococcales bacterium]|nr:hypothetical protein [Myxococcales bacterium]